MIVQYHITFNKLTINLRLISFASKSYILLSSESTESTPSYSLPCAISPPSLIPHRSQSNPLGQIDLGPQLSLPAKIDLIVKYLLYFSYKLMLRGPSSLC